MPPPTKFPTTTAATPGKSQQPLFRAQTPDGSEDSDEDDVRPPPPSARKLTAADSDSDENAQDDDNDDDDEDDELAAQLLQKAVITPSKAQTPRPSATASASASARKGKAREREFSPGPEQGSNDDIATALARPPTQSAPASTATYATVHGGDLHLYDRATGMFMLQEKDVKVGLHRVSQGEGGHWLLVEGEKGPWVSQRVDGETSFSEVSGKLSSSAATCCLESER